MFRIASSSIGHKMLEFLPFSRPITLVEALRAVGIEFTGSENERGRYDG